jgi:hypothetical protein
MKLTDIINPWGALRAARKDIAAREADVAYYERELSMAHKAIRDTHNSAAVNEKAHALVVHNLKAEIKRLEKIIADGHYRNPETGRLGRRGEVFTR